MSKKTSKTGKHESVYEAPKSSLKINMKGSEKIGAKEEEIEIDIPYEDEELSLDAIIAQEDGKWLCEYCETINTRSAGVCVACGKRISYVL